MDKLHVSDLLNAMRSVDKTKLSLAERLEVATACKNLQLEVERPWDSILRIVWHEVSLASQSGRFCD